MIVNISIQLQPIIEAQPVPFTMETLGWKILLFIVLSLIIYIGFKVYQQYKNNQYRRDAILKINNLNTTLADYELITQIMFWIKQTALQTYGRGLITPLEGEKWLMFLDSKIKNSFFSQNKELITSAIYKNKTDTSNNFDRQVFKSQSIKWIKNHA